VWRRHGFFSGDSNHQMRVFAAPNDRLQLVSKRLF
jgi:hypothetical protein